MIVNKCDFDSKYTIVWTLLQILTWW